MKLYEIEITLANYFNYRQNLIVPNVFWGMGFLHECDLLVLTRSRYAWEIEIKTSMADLKRDQKKWHNHESGKISRLYFAFPKDIGDFWPYIPERAGVFVLWKEKKKHFDSSTLNYTSEYTATRIKKLREAKINHNYKFSDEEKFNLARLGAMRIWGLKKSILKT